VRRRREYRARREMTPVSSNNCLIVQWNLPRLAADLAVYFESKGDAVWYTLDAATFLGPYNLTANDYETVVRLACHEDCLDCGCLFNHYMVSDGVWQQAGLRPTDNCCLQCLPLRLKRPLQPHDFSACWLNYEAGLAPLRPGWQRQ
jgi:hypothetical protein